MKKICENPKCGKEHDGSYGSGRFCSKSCRMAYIGSKSNKNGKLTGHPQYNHIEKAPYGTWKCKFCGLVFDTKRLLWDHYRSEHADSLGSLYNKGGKAWNKGFTSQTNESVAKGASVRKQKYSSGELIPSWLGKHHSEETKKRLSISAFNSTHQRVTKKTMPYTKKDGTIVNLDSSYERFVAKFLDENNIEWIRPKPLIWIDSVGKEHHYFPDFYIPSLDIFLDPKNDYCFTVQSEKITYIKLHYPKVVFIHKYELTKEYLKKLLSLE